MLFFFGLDFVLIQLRDHIKPILDLLLELFLEVDDSVDIDRFVLKLAVLFVEVKIATSVGTICGRMPKGSVVLDGDELVQGSVIHQKDLLIGETEVSLGHSLIAEACLDDSASDHILTVQVVVVFEQVVQVALGLVVFLSSIAVVTFGRLTLTGFDLVAFVWVLSRLEALFAPVDSVALLRVPRARLTCEHSFTELNEASSALGALHVGLSDEL